MKIPNEKCRNFIKSLPKAERQFPTLFAGVSEEAQDFLAKTLLWDPECRMNIEEAIQHPYVEKLHCPEDEPTRGPLDTSGFEFERRKITSLALREEIFREALHYYPHLEENFKKEELEDLERYDISQYRLLVPGESQYSSDEEVDSD